MNILRRIFAYLSPTRASRPPFADKCGWCEKPLTPGRPDVDWWTRGYCSNECGHKSIDAKNAGEKRLDDAMDATHDRFEDR